MNLVCSSKFAQTTIANNAKRITIGPFRQSYHNREEKKKNYLETYTNMFVNAELNDSFFDE